MGKSIPPKSMLEKISSKGKYASKYFSFPRNLSEYELKNLLFLSADKRVSDIEIFYNAKIPYAKVYSLFMEAMQNAIAHGPKDKDFIMHSLFLGDKGIIHGFRDFGDYFKSEETQKIWENKIIIKSTNETNFSGRGFGNGIIYGSSDLIKVDTQKGILYCMQTLGRLEIIPEYSPWKD